MKKILLATTVLAASAGFAAADVAVSGAGRMGIAAAPGLDAQFSSRIRIIFSATGETDSGLTFGASVRNDQSGVGNKANGDSTVFISGAFGKITMGDVSGAADALVGQVSGVGYTSLGSLNEITYLGNEKTAALYTYSTGALTFGLGIGQTGTIATPAAPPAAAIRGDAYSVAVKYATDAYSIALGYENTDLDGHQTSVLGSATFSGVTIKAKYADRSSAADPAYALSADYTMSGIGLTAFYANNSQFDGFNHYGMGASYDLGGGASILGGVVETQDDGLAPAFDLGIKMSF
jgi:outer membrane protein OmpU